MIACVTHGISTSVISAILGFLAGVAADFKPSTSLMIACFTTLGVVIGSLLVLVVASYGPGLSRTWPQ